MALTLREAALLLWLDDYPGDSARMFAYLTDAERLDYEARAQALLDRARLASRHDRLGEHLDAQRPDPRVVRVRIGRSAAAILVEDMRDAGLEPVRDGMHVTFEREGRPDPRFEVKIGELEAYLDIRPGLAIPSGDKP